MKAFYLWHVVYCLRADTELIAILSGVWKCAKTTPLVFDVIHQV